MKLEDFEDSPSGKAVNTIHGYPAFIPNPLPPKLDANELIMPLAQAQEQLGALREVGRNLNNPYLLLRPLMSREAVLSSSMEGTVTTLTDLFAYEAGEGKSVSDETREVHNYTRAMTYAVKKLDTLPMSKRLISETHEILLQRVSKSRGLNKRPGEFRENEPAWTGTHGTPISEARFVFAPPESVIEKFSELENYMSRLREDDIPLLFKIALIHYQFETIHPFFDGNGRIGRQLIPLLLYCAEALPHPMLYMSPYFERNKDEYIERLYEVSRCGAWEGWITFFLNGVMIQARDTIERFHKLQNLQIQYRDKLSQARQSASLLQLVDFICEYPVVSIPRAAEHLGMTYHGAQNNINKLLEAEILVELPGELRPRLFMAHGVYSIVNDPIIQ